MTITAIRVDNLKILENTMTEIATAKIAITAPIDVAIGSRIIEEGYGPGAWHGADLRAALSDVTARTAFWRPGTGRHNIAEIALHHAACVRSVIGQLTGREEAAFPLEGSDWFDASDEKRMAWPSVLDVVDAQQTRLASVVADIGSGAQASPLSDAERFDLLLGVTCHAVYHAGQIQLIKVLNT
jgi:hypothetical protein